MIQNLNASQIGIHKLDHSGLSEGVQGRVNYVELMLIDLMLLNENVHNCLISCMIIRIISKMLWPHNYMCRH